MSCVQDVGVAENFSLSTQNMQAQKEQSKHGIGEVMSNSEIIEWLKKKSETVTMPGARKMYQAAVKALEAQKYMVSRQAVIDELMTWEGHCITDQEEWHLRQVIGSIKSIPGGKNDT